MAPRHDANIVSRYSLTGIITSALKHGQREGDIAEVWADPLARAAWIDDDEPRRLLLIGNSIAGVSVELVAPVFDDERALVIHAMKARKSTLKKFEEEKP